MNKEKLQKETNIRIELHRNSTLCSQVRAFREAAALNSFSEKSKTTWADKADNI